MELLDIFRQLHYTLSMKDDILAMAAVCRRACEEYNDTHGTFWAGLGGMCGMASHFLFGKLSEFSSPIFILAENDDGTGAHCWVKVGRLNVDITATQFDPTIPPIFTYTGHKEQHPLLLRHYRFSFPHQYNFFETKDQNDVRRFLKKWDSAYQYQGKYKKRLDRYF